MSTKLETKDTKPKLELETSCGQSFKAWTDAAREVGLVLRAPRDLDSGDCQSFKIYLYINSLG